MKFDITEIKTITLKKDEHLAVTVPYGTSMTAMKRLMKYLADMFGDDADRILICREGTTFEKIKFESEDDVPK